MIGERKGNSNFTLFYLIELPDMYPWTGDWLVVLSHHAKIHTSGAGIRVSLKPWFFTWMGVVSTECSRAHFGELHDHVSAGCFSVMCILYNLT